MLCPAAFRKKGTSSQFLTHNFSCRRVNVLFLWCYVLTHKFSFHCEKDCLRSPDCEKTGQLATRKRYASERACFRPSTAQIPVKIYRSNAKSYSTNDTSCMAHNGYPRCTGPDDRCESSGSVHVTLRQQSGSCTKASVPLLRWRTPERGTYAVLTPRGGQRIMAMPHAHLLGALQRHACAAGGVPAGEKGWRPWPCES